MAITISFIIAAYNIEKYIGKCLDEFSKIRSKDCEFLIINDGSTDCTSDICQKYIDADSRFRMINKPNGGISSARNLGLQCARGKWIVFWDGDDWISEGFGDYLFDVLDDKYEIICFGMRKVYTEYINTSNYFKKDKRDFYNIEGISINTIRHGLLNVDLKDFQVYTKKNMNLTSAWGKVYQKKILLDNNLSFNNRLVWAEDIIFVFETLRYTNKILCISDIGYNYRIQAQSMMNSYKAGKHKQILNAVSVLWERIFSQKETDMINDAYIFTIRQFLYALKTDICHPDNFQSYWKRKKEFYNLKSIDFFSRSFERGQLQQFRTDIRWLAKLCKYNLFFCVDILIKIKISIDKYKMR